MASEILDITKFEISEKLKKYLQAWIESEKDYLKKLNDE